MPVPFDEEKVDSYELGAKIDVGGDFRLNVAAFQADYQDMQLIFRQGVVPLLFNAGKATIRGFEAELQLSSDRPSARSRRIQHARRRDQEHHADSRGRRHGRAR